MRPRSPAPLSRRGAREEAKRRVLADELAREAQAHAEELAPRGRGGRGSCQGRAAGTAADGGVRGFGAGAIRRRWRRVCLVSGSASQKPWPRRPGAARGRGAARSGSEAGDDLSRWNLAREASRAVERLLGDARDDATRGRVTRLVKQVSTAAVAAEADRQLVESLIDIRSAGEDDLGSATTDANYAAAFRRGRARPDGPLARGSRGTDALAAGLSRGGAGGGAGSLGVGATRVSA